MAFFYGFPILLGIAFLGLFLAKKEGAFYCKISKELLGKILIVISICGAYALTLGNVLKIEGYKASINLCEWGYYFLISLFAIGFASLFFGSKLAQGEEKTQ